MRRAAFLPLAAVIVLGWGCAASRPPTKVRYIANEGFLIEIGSKKVLIDALFDDETINYSHVPDSDTLDRIAGSDAPFDDVDLVLFTHGHRDHFSVGQVMRHLAGSPSSIVVGPPQAVEQLESSPRTMEEHGDRIKKIDLGLFESAALKLNGIHVEAHRIRHSEFMVTDDETGEQYNLHENVENLAYLVSYRGVKLLHVGDAILPINREFFESERFSSEKLDIVFLEFFDESDETREILERSMRPDHIVFMHLPPQREKIEGLTRHLLERFPNAEVFQNRLEVRSF